MKPVASETSGPNDSNYYTAGIDILDAFDNGSRAHYSAIEFHSKDRAEAEARRDLVLRTLIAAEGPVRVVLPEIRGWEWRRKGSDDEWALCTTIPGDPWQVSFEYRPLGVIEPAHTYLGSSDAKELADRLASMPAAEAIRGPRDWVTIQSALRGVAQGSRRARWGRPMSEATEFLGWLIEDVCMVNAEVGTPRDIQLKEFEIKGFLRLSGTFADTNNYEITSGYTAGLALSSTDKSGAA